MKHDLAIYTFDNQSLPGFFVADIPKHPARGREDDSLMLLLTLQGGRSVSGEQLRQWQGRLADIFYRTSGSVTSAMRSVIEAINLTLVERNLKLLEDSDRVSAYLSLGVIHHDTLFIAQSGLSQALLLKVGGQTVFFDPDLGARGLGLSQVPKVRYFQDALSNGDFVLLSTEFPPSWLQGGTDLSLPSDPQNLWQRMQEQAPLPAPVGLVQVKEGEGLTQVRTFALPQIQAEPAAEAESAVAEAETQAESETAPMVVEETASETASTAVEVTAEEEPPKEQAEEALPEAELINEEPAEPEIHPGMDETGQTQTTAVVDAAIEREAQRKERERKRAEQAARQAEKGLRKKETYRAVADGAGRLNSLGAKIAGVFTKSSRTQADEVVSQKASLSRGTKLLLAIVVPLVVVAIGSGIYISKGREDQYQYLMAQAQAAAENAALMGDAAQEREGWNQVTYWLDQAETYRQSDEVQAMRFQAQEALDELDDAIRLIYKPAYPGSQLPSLDISRIVSVGSDLYLLDRATGVVLHLNPTNTGYSLDMDFNCQPGVYGGVSVSNLVDLTAVPINNPSKAPILALDGNGNSLYCGVDKDPTAVALIPPDSGWGQIKSISFDSGRLFVLDPVKNALWIYRGFSAQFNTPPDLYFEEKPVDLSEAVEAVVGGDELFILYADGHTSHCLASNVSGTVECEDPYIYQDGRPGAAAADVDFDSLNFGKLSYSPPPDPSLYYLAPSQAELYQFSLRLNLNRVLRAAVSSGALPNRAVTAFNVSSNRNVFLAFGNELYYAVIP
ncbi:MAG: cell envelope integrity protein TolA [Anaerolineaceae bacterium]